MFVSRRDNEALHRDHATIMTQMHELKSNLIKLSGYCATDNTCIAVSSPALGSLAHFEADNSDCIWAAVCQLQQMTVELYSMMVS